MLAFAHFFSVHKVNMAYRLPLPLITNCYVNLAHVAFYMYVELNVSQLDA